MKSQHWSSVSGGKDSTATTTLGVEWREKTGHPFYGVFADTGNEHPATYDYVRYLEEKTGIPIRWVKADFSADMERKRAFIARKWPLDGIPQERVDRAVKLLHPTGNPFLDLCMMKGRFPSRRAQFCTEKLKRDPILEQVILPIIDDGEAVWSWQGIRRDEANSPDHPRSKLTINEHVGGNYWIHRPIYRWTVQDVFAQHARHGIEPNPLYRQGMNRVGCMPCINCAKEELREIAKRFPEEIERIAEWEAIASEASKRGHTTFFSYDKTPGEHQRHKDLPMPGIKVVVEWSKTARGGRQYDLMVAADTESGCTSAYGLCE